MPNPNLPKKKLSSKQAKGLLPVFKQFNKIAGFFIKSLNKQIEQKQRRVNQINIVLKDMKLPASTGQHNISIQTIDINDTRIKKKGNHSFNKKMDWESDIPSKKKGIIL